MIEQAKQKLKSENLTCVLINQSQTKTANSMGIKHLIDWHTENPNVFADGIVADTIVGLAAASILIFGGLKEIYGEIMSQSAADLLAAHNVTFSYGKIVKNIKNRAGTDICPMEKICLAHSGPESAFAALRAKIKEVF